MSNCIEYQNTNEFGGSVYVSGTTCEGIVGAFTLNFGDDICMRSDEPIITCENPTIMGACFNNPTPTPTVTSTPTQTPSNTATQTQTPTNTATPTQTQTPSTTLTATPTQTPTQTPTNTRTQTPTNTQTKTPTQTQTQTPTSTMEPLCPEQVTIQYISGPANSTFNGTYDRVYISTGGTMNYYYNQSALKVYNQADSFGFYGIPYGRFDGTTYYTIFAQSISTPSNIIRYLVGSSAAGYIWNITNLTNSYSLSSVQTSSNIKLPNRGLNIGLSDSTFYVSYPDICPTPSPTNTNTATATPTQTPTPSVTIGITPTPTPSITASQTETPTQTPTNTNTGTPTITPTQTNTSTQTPTNTQTQTPTMTGFTIPCVCVEITATNTDPEGPAGSITYNNCFGTLVGEIFLTTGTRYRCIDYTGGVLQIFSSTNVTYSIASGYSCSGGTCPTDIVIPLTPTPTPTNTLTPTPSTTIGASPTQTETPTQTPTPTNTETPTQTNTPTNTQTSTPTGTSSVVSPTPTSTPTNTPTNATAQLDITNGSLDIQITSVSVNGVATSVIGGSLPNTTGNGTNLSTTQIGTYTIDVNYSCSVAGQKITLTDSDLFSTCINTSTGSNTATFTTQVVATYHNVLIDAQDGTC